jgi:branched-chain amino acid transport system substrate-binding protein
VLELFCCYAIISAKEGPTMSGTQERRSAFGRRAFLKAAASVGVALAADPLLSTAAHAHVALDRTVSSRRAFRIGVLVPESRLYPALATSLLAGLRLGFAERGNLAGERLVELLPEGYGDRVGAATKQARALIVDQHVDLLVGMLSSAATMPLHDLLQAHQVPFIVTNVGANVIRSRGQSPYIFRTSLNHWQANWAAGSWAANHIGKKAFVATSFYESGYDTAYMFSRGLERAGGTVLGRQVTHRPRETDTFTPLLAAIKQTNPDLVYAAYSGQQALDFTTAYANAGLAGRVPLVGSGFMLDESLLGQYGDAAIGSISGFAWSPELDTTENRAFAAAYRTSTGRTADPFAVLGYDSARLIADALDATAGNSSNSDNLLKALRTRELHSPRGSLVMDQWTQSVVGPLYIREVRQHQGSFSNSVIAKIDASPAFDADAAAIRSSVKTGWLNAYLAV